MYIRDSQLDCHCKLQSQGSFSCCGYGGSFFFSNSSISFRDNVAVGIIMIRQWMKYVVYVVK